MKPTASHTPRGCEHSYLGTTDLERPRCFLDAWFNFTALNEAEKQHQDPQMMSENISYFCHIYMIHFRHTFAEHFPHIASLYVKHIDVILLRHLEVEHVLRIFVGFSSFLFIVIFCKNCYVCVKSAWHDYRLCFIALATSRGCAC